MKSENIKSTPAPDIHKHYQRVNIIKSKLPGIIRIDHSFYEITYALHNNT